MKHAIPSPYMTAGEAAHYLRLEERTINNMRWRGEGPLFRKHGGKVIYHREDLDSWSRTRNGHYGPLDDRLWRRQLERARLKHLSGMELVQPLGKGRWSLSETARDTLMRMGERGDIIKAMHRAMSETDKRRVDGASFFDPSSENVKPVTGRIIQSGISRPCQPV